jgi:hypothetical protein
VTGARWLAALAVAAALVQGGCMFPADVSGQYRVTLPSSVLVLTVGDTARLEAVVLHRTRPVDGVVVDYASGDPSLVVVDSTGLVRGIKPGLTEVTATARRFQNAEPAVRSVRVLSGVEIDTVVPTLSHATGGHTVMWGEPVTVVGRGLDPSALGPVLVDQYPAVLQSFVPAASDDPNAVDTMRLWIPALAPDSSNLFFSRRSGSAALWPLRVVQHDILEPNDVSPLVITLGDSLRYPGLALEVVDSTHSPANCGSVWFVAQGQCWTDRYQIRIPTGPRDLTMVFKFPAPLQALPVAIEVTNTSNLTPAQWLIAQNWSLCYTEGNNPQFYPIDNQFEALSDSFLIALKDLPPQLIDVSLTLFAVQTPATPAPTGSPPTTPYEMRILPTYQTALSPDTAEENDFCQSAFALPYPTASLGLNFDHGGDLDWYSLTVPPPDTASPATGRTVTETEPNDLIADADTVVLGDTASGAVNPAGDVDNFAFYADSGATLDLEVRADRTGESNLDSFLMLLQGGEVIAINDDMSSATPDSRITVTAPRTGWYTVQLRDKFGRGGQFFPYQLFVRALGSESADLTIAAVPDQGQDLDPVVELFDDTRLTDGGINLELSGAGQVQTIVRPGPYLVLIFDRNGKPGTYHLTLIAEPLAIAPPARAPARRRTYPVRAWRR